MALGRPQRNGGDVMTFALSFGFVFGPGPFSFPPVFPCRKYFIKLVDVVLQVAKFEVAPTAWIIGMR